MLVQVKHMTKIKLSIKVSGILIGNGPGGVVRRIDAASQGLPACTTSCQPIEIAHLPLLNVTDSPSLVVFSCVHLPALIGVIGSFVIFLLDLGDSTVQIPAEVLDAPLPVDIAWSITALLGCVHGVKHFLQSVVGVVSWD